MVWNCYVVQNWYNGLKKVHDALNLRKNIQNGTEVFKMTLNREEWRQTTQMNENGWKLFKIEQNSSKVVKIGPKRNKQIWAIESASQLKKHFNYLIWHIWPNFIVLLIEPCASQACFEFKCMKLRKDKGKWKPNILLPTSPMIECVMPY